MGKFCAVLGCTSGPEVPSHRFSKKPEKSSRWLEVVKSQTLKDLTMEEISKLCICHKHFKDTDYMPYYLKRILRPDAIPSLLIPIKQTQLEASMEKGSANEPKKEPSTEIPKTNSDADNDGDNNHSVVIAATSIPAQLSIQSKKDKPRHNVVKIGGKTKKKRPKIRPEILETELTPKAKCLYEIAKVMQRRNKINEKKMLNLKTRLLSVKRLTENGSLEKHLRSLSKSQLVLIRRQLRSSKQIAQGKVFNEQEESLAFSIHQRFPVSYRFLQETLVLPSVRT